MSVFPPRTVTFAFWQCVGHGPATGRGLWGAMHPPPGSGPGRSACSSRDITSAEGLSSPHAGSSQPPTASMSKFLNHLVQCVSLTTLAAGLDVGPLQKKANALYFVLKINCRRDWVIFISQDCSVTFKPSLSLLAQVQVFIEKESPQEVVQIKGSSFPTCWTLPSSWEISLKQHLNARL